MLRDPRRGSLV